MYKIQNPILIFNQDIIIFRQRHTKVKTQSNFESYDDKK